MREVMDRLRAVIGGEPTHTQVLQHLHERGARVDLSSISCWMSGRRMSARWLRRIAPLDLLSSARTAAKVSVMEPLRSTT